MHYPNRFLLILLFLATVLFSGCDTPPPTKSNFQIGIINPSAGLSEVVNGFKEGLTALGYREGDNLTYIDYGPIKMNDVATTIKAMLDEDIDLLYTTTTRATQIAKQTVAGLNVPIVFAPVFAPEKSNIVDSLPNPGGNITGVKVGGCSSKTFQCLMEALPNATHIYIPYHCTDPAAGLCYNDMTAAAQHAGVTVVTANVTNKLELEEALRHIPANADAMWLSCSPLIFANLKEIVDAATARKVPVISTTHQQEDGVMLSYGINNIALGKQASRIAGQILKGIPPESLPVETAEYFLNVNLAVAADLGINIPHHLLQQADVIIRPSHAAQRPSELAATP